MLKPYPLAGDLVRLRVGGVDDLHGRSAFEANVPDRSNLDGVPARNQPGRLTRARRAGTRGRSGPCHGDIDDIVLVEKADAVRPVHPRPSLRHLQEEAERRGIGYENLVVRNISQRILLGPDRPLRRGDAWHADRPEGHGHGQTRRNPTAFAADVRARHQALLFTSLRGRAHHPRISPFLEPGGTTESATLALVSRRPGAGPQMPT